MIELLKENALLRIEFEDCLNSDPHFNYKENEFEEWLMDLVVPNLLISESQNEKSKA